MVKQGKDESLHWLREVQGIAEEVPYAWDRSDNSDGHFLQCHELYLQGYN